MGKGGGVKVFFEQASMKSAKKKKEKNPKTDNKEEGEWREDQFREKCPLPSSPHTALGVKTGRG